MQAEGDAFVVVPVYEEGGDDKNSSSGIII